MGLRAAAGGGVERAATALLAGAFTGAFTGAFAGAFAPALAGGCRGPNRGVVGVIVHLFFFLARTFVSFFGFEADLALGWGVADTFFGFVFFGVAALGSVELLFVRVHPDRAMKLTRRATMIGAR